MRSVEDRLFERWCRHADAGALGKLFDRVAPRLLALGIHLVGESAEAEDLVQATFLAAIEQRASLDPTRPAMPWFTSVLGHKAKDARKRAARRIDPERLVERSEEDPAQPIERRELSGELAQAIDRLEDPYREVLILRLRHGLSIADVAHVVERSPGTVRVQLHRALEKLRPLLPASLATALVLCAVSPRGLSAVKSAVLREAAATGAVMSSSTIIGGWIVSQKIVGAAVAGVAFLALGIWRFGSFGSTEIESVIAEAREQGSLQVPDRVQRDATQVEEPQSSERVAAEEPPNHSWVRGIVLDAESRQPIAGATLRLFAPERLSLFEAARLHPELYEVQGNGTIRARTHADWPFIGEVSALARFDRETIATYGGLLPEAEPLARVTSDTGGRFTLPADSTGGVLACEKDGYGQRIRAAHDTSREWTVALWREHEIVGLVATFENEPPGELIQVAFTAVQMPPPPPIEELKGRPRSYEDAEIEGLGAWVAECDESGSFSVRIVGEQFDAHILTPGWRARNRQRFSRDAPVLIVVQRVPVLHVFDAVTRAPIERVRLLGKESVNLYVRWSGEFDAPGGLLALPGDAFLFQWHEQDSFSFSAWAEGYRATSFPISELTGARVVEVPLERGAVCPIEGVVRRGERPCSGAEVALVAFHWDDECLLDAFRADRRGQFRLESGPGMYLIRVMDEGTTYFEPIELPASAALDIDLDRTGRIEVEIVDASGVPRAQHVVGLSWADTRHHRDQRGYTDEHGLVSFAPLPPGRFTVMAPHVSTESSFSGDELEEIELGRGESRRVRLEIPMLAGPRHARIVARGVDQYSDWRVQLPFLGPDWHALESDGTVPVDLATTAYTMDVAAPDERRWRVPIPKDAPDGQEIHLDAGEGSYRGVLLDSEGMPKVRTRIYLEPWRCQDCVDLCASTVTDAGGQFEVAGLQPCTYRFEFREGAQASETYDGTFGSMTFVPSQPASENPRLEIRLAPPPEEFQLRGIVRRTGDGAPLTDAFVVFECELTSDSGLLLVGREHSMTRTNAEGRFEIDVPRTPTRTVRVYDSWAKNGLVLTQTFQDTGLDEEPPLELIVP